MQEHVGEQREDGGQQENTFSKFYKYPKTVLKSQENRRHIKAKCMGNRTIKYLLKQMSAISVHVRRHSPLKEKHRFTTEIMSAGGVFRRHGVKMRSWEV